MIALRRSCRVVGAVVGAVTGKDRDVVAAEATTVGAVLLFVLKPKLNAINNRFHSLLRCIHAS